MSTAQQAVEAKKPARTTKPAAKPAAKRTAKVKDLFTFTVGDTKVDYHLAEIDKARITKANQAGENLASLSKDLALYVFAGRDFPAITISRDKAKADTSLQYVNGAVYQLFNVGGYVVKTAKANKVDMAKAWQKYVTNAKRKPDLSINGLKAALREWINPKTDKPAKGENSGAAGKVEAGEVKGTLLSAQLATFSQMVNKSDVYSEALLNMLKAATAQALTDEDLANDDKQ
jgi:hypothetical protein